MALTAGRLVKGGTNDGTNQNILDASWTTKTAAYTAVAGDRILADSSGGAFTITLPVSPAAGDEIEISDPTGDWETYNVTVSGNSKNIESLSDDLVLNVANASIRLIYIDATIGWAIRQIC